MDNYGYVSKFTQNTVWTPFQQFFKQSLKENHIFDMKTFEDGSTLIQMSQKLSLLFAVYVSNEVEQIIHMSTGWWFSPNHQFMSVMFVCECIGDCDWSIRPEKCSLKCSLFNRSLFRKEWRETNDKHHMLRRDREGALRKTRKPELLGGGGHES